MEWFLQLIDEVDDALGLVRHCWFGFDARKGVLMACAVALAAMSAALVVGQEAAAICAAILVASLGAALEARRRLSMTFLNHGRTEIL